MGERPLVVVTGASSGIGRAAAVLFAASGYDVVAVARRRDALDALRAEAGSAVEVEACDMSDAAQASALSRRVVERRGAPYAVVNSAGAGAWKYVEDTTPEEVQAWIGAPYLAAVNACRGFLPSMRAARRGVVVHVQSPAAYQPWPGATIYASARYALRGLHEALVVDLAGSGVTSCHAVFGEVESGYWEANPGSREHMPSISRILPTMTPEQCARALLDVVRRPRTSITRPFAVHAMILLARVAPGALRALVVATGRRR